MKLVVGPVYCASENERDLLPYAIDVHTSAINWLYRMRTAQALAHVQACSQDSSTPLLSAVMTLSTFTQACASLLTEGCWCEKIFLLKRFR